MHYTTEQQHHSTPHNDMTEEEEEAIQVEAVMTGVRELGEGSEVILSKRGKHLVIDATNEGGYNCTLIILEDLINWLHHNKPELLIPTKP